jgi:hypothetical protein
MGFRAGFEDLGAGRACRFGERPDFRSASPWPGAWTSCMRSASFKPGGPSVNLFGEGVGLRGWSFQFGSAGSRLVASRLVASRRVSSHQVPSVQASARRSCSARAGAGRRGGSGQRGGGGAVRCLGAAAGGCRGGGPDGRFSCGRSVKVRASQWRLRGGSVLAAVAVLRRLIATAALRRFNERRRDALTGGCALTSGCPGSSIPRESSAPSRQRPLREVFQRHAMCKPVPRPRVEISGKPAGWRCLRSGLAQAARKRMLGSTQST